MDIVPPGAKFLSICEPMKPENKYVLPKHNGGPGMDSSSPKRRKKKGKSGSWVQSKSVTQCTSISNGLGLLI